MADIIRGNYSVPSFEKGGSEHILSMQALSFFHTTAAYYL
ncbi:hypothetical protein CRENPOLYSF1_150029 [Crenothrix polyspora]|uniref:Uncharacterized protein n=1 Tax=Crenothrix polyspora TaxID=360316 RepID=A0A1R4H3Y7_9GAMM|nr:hypothetical protein CRENPOLYSF1_150029 [Crenothrix polyspora]